MHPFSVGYNKIFWGSCNLVSAAAIMRADKTCAVCARAKFLLAFKFALICARPTVIFLTLWVLFL